MLLLSSGKLQPRHRNLTPCVPMQVSGSLAAQSGQALTALSKQLSNCAQVAWFNASMCLVLLPRFMVSDSSIVFDRGLRFEGVCDFPRLVCVCVLALIRFVQLCPM